MDEDVVTAVDPLDNEAAAFKRPHDFEAAQLPRFGFMPQKALER